MPICWYSSGVMYFYRSLTISILIFCSHPLSNAFDKILAFKSSKNTYNLSALNAMPTWEEKANEADKIPNEGDATWKKLMVLIFFRDSLITKPDYGMFSTNLTIISLVNLLCGLSKASLLWEYPISSLIYSMKNQNSFTTNGNPKSWCFLLSEQNILFLKSGMIA